MTIPSRSRSTSTRPAAPSTINARAASKPQRRLDRQSDRNGAPQVCRLGTIPLLVSAPHGLQLYRRGAPGTNERTRIHKRERWTTELALRLAVAAGAHTRRLLLDGLSIDAKELPGTSTAGFLVWNCATVKPLDRRVLDPNYLFSSQFVSSPWHQALVTFASAAAQLPAGVVPLHVDLHGKYDRADDFHIDVGIESMRCCSHGPRELTARLEKSLAQHLGHAVKACRTKHPKLGTSPTIDMDPDLHGLWGTDLEHDPHTMTTQAVLLGLPSVQLEVPNTVRHALMTEPEFFSQFAEAVARVFVDLQPEAALHALREHVLREDAASASGPSTLLVARSMLLDCERAYSDMSDRQI